MFPLSLLEITAVISSTQFQTIGSLAWLCSEAFYIHSLDNDTNQELLYKEVFGLYVKLTLSYIRGRM